LVAADCTSTKLVTDRAAQVIHNREVLIEIWEEQHGKIEVGPIHRQKSILQIALLLIILNLGFDHVGPRDLAAVLQLLADTEKVVRFRSRLLRVAYLRCATTYP